VELRPEHRMIGLVQRRIEVEERRTVAWAEVHHMGFGGQRRIGEEQERHTAQEVGHRIAVEEVRRRAEVVLRIVGIVVEARRTAEVVHYIAVHIAVGEVLRIVGKGERHKAVEVEERSRCHSEDTDYTCCWTSVDDKFN